MKRDTIYTIITATLLTTFVWCVAIPQQTLAALSCSVTTSCPSGAVIFHMASTSNSHAELPSQSNYANLVCCTGVGALSNTCSGKYAVVLNLASTTNSHVEENTGTSYTNFACISVTSGYTFSVGYQSGSCSGYDTTVASIANPAGNSHVGDLNAYTTKVCASAVANTLTFTTDASSEALPAAQPGTLVATSTILYVNSSNASGFSMSIQRASTAPTLSLSGSPSNTIPDKTDWVTPANVSTAGNATASTTQPTSLQFRIRNAGTDSSNYSSAWWGSNDTTAGALFAGISSTSQTIINRSTATTGTSTSYSSYDVTIPSNQVSGSYSGSITYSVVANP